MRSLINKKNSSKISYSFLTFLLFLYVCPNIKYFGTGEMSYLPGLIILSAFSLLSRAEFFKFCVFLFFSSLLPFINFAHNKFPYYSQIYSFISIYILIVPILTSILLGRIIGFRFSENAKEKNQIELKKTIILLSTTIFLSGLINKIAPSILSLIIHTNRTSFSRWTFFFTEPSQGSSVLLMFWFTSFHIIFRKSFYDFFGKNKKLFLVFIPLVSIIFTYLSLPTTLLVQLLIFFGLNFLILFFGNLLKILLRLKIKIKIIENWRIKQHTLFSFFLLSGSLSFSFLLFYLMNSKLMFGLKNFVIGSTNPLLSFFYIGGTRFYYSFAAVISSLENPFNLPGSYYGRFVSELLKINSRFDINVDDNFLQVARILPENVLKIKPIGWFYFSIFDLGIIGFIIFCLIFLFSFLMYLFKGIIRIDFIAISLFSVQIALLIMPILPSTPSVFFPLLIYSALDIYKKNKNQELYN